PTSQPAIPHSPTATLATTAVSTLTAASSTLASLQSKPGPVTKFALSAPLVPCETAGSGFTITLTPEDAAGNYANYVGWVHFTSSDPKAVLPPDVYFNNVFGAVGRISAIATYALTGQLPHSSYPVYVGPASFSVTLKTSGSQTITATALG